MEQRNFPVFSKQPTRPSRLLADWHFLPLILTEKYTLPEESSHSIRPWPACLPSGGSWSLLSYQEAGGSFGHHAWSMGQKYYYILVPDSLSLPGPIPGAKERGSCLMKRIPDFE